jgi:hypothetical protein
MIANPQRIASRIQAGSAGVFWQGPPRYRQLQENPELAILFRALLVALDMQDLEEIEKKYQHAALMARKSGWLHPFLDSKGWQYLTFASPLHRFMVSSLLVPSECHVPFPSLLNFVKTVAANMRPSLLNTISRAVPQVSGITFCENRWQAEFYRSSAALGHSILLMPESIIPPHAAKSGRIDFFIAGPQTNWGVEILRDERDLEEYNSDAGAYKWWIDNDIISDFVVLDFRCKPVSASHPSKTPLLLWHCIPLTCLF